MPCGEDSPLPAGHEVCFYLGPWVVRQAQEAASGEEVRQVPSVCGKRPGLHVVQPGCKDRPDVQWATQPPEYPTRSKEVLKRPSGTQTPYRRLQADRASYCRCGLQRGEALRGLQAR